MPMYYIYNLLLEEIFLLLFRRINIISKDVSKGINKIDYIVQGVLEQLVVTQVVKKFTVKNTKVYHHVHKNLL
jgi:hypothetical protein